MKNKILIYFHCNNCLSQIGLEPGSGFGEEKLAVGWTKKGLQVWCEGCGKNVIALDFKGQKVNIDTEKEEKEK